MVLGDLFCPTVGGFGKLLTAFIRGFCKLFSDLDISMFDMLDSMASSGIDSRWRFVYWLMPGEAAGLFELGFYRD